MLTRDKLHPAFRLNGEAYNREALQELGYSLVKEGEAYEREIGDFLIDWFADSPTLTVETSGSTGIPGRHLLRKQGMIQSARATIRFFNLKPENTALLCLPAQYIGGKMMLVRAMVAGLSLDYVKPVATPLDNLNTSYDFCAMVPKQYLASLKEMSKLRQLIVGGAPLGSKGRKAAQLLETMVYETFGMTETISHIALRRVHPYEPAFSTLEGVTVTSDTRGCLVVHAPQLFSEPVYTNDLVRVISETAFEWLGRHDNIINSGGIKMVPEQLEHKYQAVLPTRFFVTALADDTLGEKLVLLVENHKDPDGLLKKLKSLSALRAYEIPKQVIVVPSFSITASGKVDRRGTLRIAGLLNP